MGGQAGAPGAGAMTPGAGGVGPVLPPPAPGAGGPGAFSLQNPAMQRSMAAMAPMMARGPENPEFIDMLARQGPPPQIQPVSGPQNQGLGQRIGAMMAPPQRRPVLPMPLNMPMTRGERLTAPPTVGAALGGGY